MKWNENYEFKSKTKKKWDEFNEIKSHEWTEQWQWEMRWRDIERMIWLDTAYWKMNIQTVNEWVEYNLNGNGEKTIENRRAMHQNEVFN